MMVHAAAVLAILALAAPDDKPGVKDGDATKLQGAWVGKAGPAEARMDARAEFQGNSLTLTFGRDAQKRVGRGTFKLDEAAKPRASTSSTSASPRTHRPSPRRRSSMSSRATRSSSAAPAPPTSPGRRNSSRPAAVRPVPCSSS